MAREPSETHIVAYKTILSEILDSRPSGTRQRLADAIGKHRSFVTQVTSPAYSTPLPAKHLPTIFRVCHVSAQEEERFLAAYQLAHPDRLPDPATTEGSREVTLRLPDLGDETLNRKLDDALQTFLADLGKLMKGGE